MAIDTKIVDQLLAENGRRPEDIAGENGLLKQLTKAILERALQAEMTEHLGYEKHDTAGYHSGNSRNGSSRKKLKGDFGEMEVETPRDRNGSFVPKIVGKNQSRWTGFDDKILSMYGRGMTTRKIQGHLGEDHSFLRFSGRNQEGNLYDECRGEPEYELAQDHQDQGLIPERGSGDAPAVSGAAESFEEMELSAGVARSSEPVPDSLAGADAGSGTRFITLDALHFIKVQGFISMGAPPPLPPGFNALNRSRYLLSDGARARRAPRSRI